MDNSFIIGDDSDRDLVRDMKRPYPRIRKNRIWMFVHIFITSTFGLHFPSREASFRLAAASPPRRRGAAAVTVAPQGSPGRAARRTEIQPRTRGPGDFASRSRWPLAAGPGHMP